MGDNFSFDGAYSTPSTLNAVLYRNATTESELPDNSSLSGFPPSSYLGPVRDPLYIVIPITILYSVIFFTGIVGNVVTCIVIARNKHMHTATNYYLFSLAVSDLLLLVSGWPQEIYSIWSRYPYVFGEAFCVLRGLAAETSANASVLTITAFTVERYVAICHPFLSHTMSKLSRAVKLILVIWVVALAFAIPQAIQFGLIYGDTPEKVLCTVKWVVMKHSFEVATFLFFVTPMTLITALYALIGLRLRRSNMMKKSSGSFSKKHSQTTQHTDATNKKSASGRHQNNQSSKRVLKMLVAVVVAFFICWAPFHVQRLVAIYGTDDDNKPSSQIMLTIYTIVTYVSGILYYVSTTINPILYHIMSLKFREAFKDTLGRCCGFRNIRSRRTRRSYSVLSRSTQRAPGTGLCSAANQESTDYSGNSFREDYPPSNGTTTTNTGGSGLRKSSFWGQSSNSAVPTDNIECRRSFSVVLSTRHGHEGDVRTSVIPALDRQHTQSSQTALLAVHRPAANKKRQIRNEKKKIWRVFKCISSSSLSSDDNRRLSASYSQKAGGCRVSVTAPGENSSMLPAVSLCMSLSNQSVATSNSNNVSNSSLKDVERGALEDELSAYMEEIRRRERC